MRIKVPPLKCQGIKTKLTPFIISSVEWDRNNRWIEPFLGSGVVAFNLSPSKAYLADANPHIINFYKDIQKGMLTPEIVRNYLQYEGSFLQKQGKEHYYMVRKRFNSAPNSLDFLFLNRACFNGLMRFNSRGEFNVPFCQKPNRFQQAYITKIVNQIRWVSEAIKDDWVFQVLDWKETLSWVNKNDFVYCDPPYPQRNNDYYNAWGEKDTQELHSYLLDLPCKWALSTWVENKHRKNPYLSSLQDKATMKTFEHHYHIGAKESNRASITEALFVKKS